MICLFRVISSLSLLFLMINSQPISAEQCNNIQLQVLGAGGPEINDGLASSSYLVWIDGKARVMVDAGGGSSLNFEKSGADFNDIQAILLSHLHVDHSAALPIYVKGSFFIGRDTPLSILGPSSGGDFPSTKDFIKALFSDEPTEHALGTLQTSVYPYLSDFIEEQPSTPYLITAKNVIAKNKVWSMTISDQLTLSAINVNHGSIPALAWRISSNNCSITFSGDTNARSDNLSLLAKNTQLFVAHNAIPEQAGKIAKTLHMTPSRIGEVANKAHAKKLILSHFMSRSVNVKPQSHALIKATYQGDIINAQELMKVPIF